jgi:putative transposase
VKGGMEEVPTSKKYEGKYSIQLLCKIAGVSKSGYYKWLKDSNIHPANITT